MRTTLILGLLTLTGPTCFFPTLRAQEPEPAPPVLREPAPVTEAEIPGEAIRKAVTDLGSSQFRVREAAENTLRQAGEKARAALKGAVDTTADEELRWRAERLLGELDRARDGEAEVQPRRGGRLRRVPQGAEPRELERGDAPQPDEFQRQFDEMRRRMDEMLRSRGVDPLPGFGDPFDRLVPGVSNGSSRSVQIGPDGVRVEVREEDENGDPVVKTYEAESLEAFREKYPEIADESLGGGGAFPGFRLRVDRGDPLTGPSIIDPFDRVVPRSGQGLRPRIQRDPVLSPSARGPKLGVYIEPVSDQLAEFLGLTPGQGQFVREVQEGSLAESMGLEAKDVLLSIAGRSVSSAEDVASVLGSLQNGAEIEVAYLRRGESKKAAGTFEMPEPSGRGPEIREVPPVSEPAPGAGEQPEGSTPPGGLRRIRRDR
ncbi:MAG: PDZ domain-containing protein [Planctomycetota bacterium]